MTPTASEATTLSKIHYTYENTYTDENRKKNNIEIVFAVLLILLPAKVPRRLDQRRRCRLESWVGMIITVHREEPVTN
jgi:hypothetical protein